MRPKVAALSLIVLALVAAPAVAQDAIDLHNATIERSAADVATWPIATAITALTIGASDCAVDFDKKAGDGAWPNVPIPGWNGGSIQYTLWLVRTVAGQVYTGGGIEFWSGRVGGCGPAAGYIANWYYDGSWGPLHDAGDLTPGETVGFFVTAGDARAKDVRTITARSAVVAVPWPGGSGGAFTFGPQAPPPVVTPPPPVIVSPPPVVVTPPPVTVPPGTPPAPLPTTIDWSQVYAELATIKADVEAGRAENQAFYADTGSKITAVLTFVTKYVLPAVGGIIAGWQVTK